jgi:crotonobetainyl-CoA:carnitine CoA-transferase CaiB-like acyl-CoA transferase
MSPMSEKPFAGINVVEFGQFIAVPYCAQLLSEGGAHVIKIESLDGDPTRHLAPLAPGETRHFISRNRGKHSLPLDLKHPQAQRVIDALLADADVVLTNLRPGLTAELGLDYAALSRRFPRMIVGNVTAFGHQGPDAKLAGMDLMMQARSGLMAANGRTRDGLPLAGDPPIIDYMCAMTLAFGISSALFRRAQTGRGGEVDVSLLMAALTLQNNLILRVESVDGPVHQQALDRLAQARARGDSYTEQAADLPQVRTNSMSSVYYRTYATKDSAIAIACVSPSLQRQLMRAVGIEDEGHLRTLPREEQGAHYRSLQTRMESILASKTTTEWKPIFNAHGVPASDVKFPIEMLDDEQAVANGMLHDLPHPSLGTVRVLSTPVNMDAAGFEPAAPTPAFGSETHDILAGLGFPPAEVAEMLESGLTTDEPHTAR